MIWLLRGILALALATAIAQTSAIVIREQLVGKIEPTPSQEPAAKPSEEPVLGPFPTAEPTPDPTPEPTPPPDIEIDIDLPLPAPVTPAPIITLPTLPPLPQLLSCTSPGSSADASGKHVGWPAQGRECAGKP